MSTAVLQVVDAAPSRPVGLLARVGRNAFALADQALISGTNFLTGVLTARALGEGEFGLFAILYGALLLANIIQSTLITQPHNVLGATRPGADYRRYTSSTALAQLVMLALLSGMIVPVVLIAYLRNWPAAGMLAALLPAVVFWQLQEFARRVLYTERRHADALANDLIGYGGQAAAIAALFFYGDRIGMPLTGATALGALAGASGIAAVVGFWRIRRSLTGIFEWQHLRENWHFGKWLAGGELMGWCSSLHMQVWWAALLVGVTAGANLRAAQILFGPMRVVTFFLGTVLPIRFALALHEGGPTALRRQVRSVLLLLAPIAGLYCALLALCSGTILKLVFGANYADAQAASVLSLFAGAAFLSYVQMVIVAALTSARLTRWVFAGSAAGCGVALLASPLLISAVGARGAIVSIIVTTLVVMAIQAWAYIREKPA